MTNPFTAFAFDASGSNQVARTMPDRLSDIHSVLDFGADPTGMTDSWQSIMNCLNWGEVTLTASGSNTGNTIPFSGGVPAVIQNNVRSMWTFDITAPSAITSGGDGTVESTTSTSVTLANIAGTVSPGDSIRFRFFARGIIYFPPGTYSVSAPIDFFQGAGDGDVNNCQCQFLGSLGASIITGGFADYVFSRLDNGTARSDRIITLENLTVINTDPAGGGIRLGATQGAAIRNCNITANKGINTTNIDMIIGDSWWGSFEVAIENCNLSPGSNVANSEGMIICSDGPILNCRIVGYASGAEVFGGEGGMTFGGCYFNDCTIGLAVGVGPGGTTNNTATGCIVLGCWFKNNSVAISGMQPLLYGTRIEGTDGAAPGGLNSQYGMENLGEGITSGVVITGNYDIAGFGISNSGINPEYTIIQGVEVTNGSATSGALPWKTSFTAAQSAPQTMACNYNPVFTVGQLPVWVATATGTWLAKSITGLTSLVGGTGYVPGSYSSVPFTGGSGTGGMGTVNVDGTGTVSSVAILPAIGTNYVVNDTLSASNTNLGGSGSGFSIKVASVADTATLTLSNSGVTGSVGSYNGGVKITVSGMTPSGYDGTFTAAAVAFNQLVYSVSGPLASGTGGTAVAYGIVNGTATVIEGDSYNVSDGTNGLNWSDLLTDTGTHTAHLKTRFNGTQFSVVGQ